MASDMAYIVARKAYSTGWYVGKHFYVQDPSISISSLIEKLSNDILNKSFTLISTILISNLSISLRAWSDYLESQLYQSSVNNGEFSIL